MKKTLIVIDDFHEFRLLVNSNILAKFEKKSAFSLCSRKNIKLGQSDRLKYLNLLSWPESISLFHQFKLWFTNQDFYLKNANSVSCQQKAIENVKLAEKRLSKKINLPRLNSLIIFLLDRHIFIRLFLRVIKFAQLGNSKAKYEHFEKFDVILFMRTSGTRNELLLARHARPDTKIIGLLRNLDTPHLKGACPKNYSYYICQNAFVETATIDLNNLDSKRIKVFKSLFLKRPKYKKIELQNKHIVVATSGPDFSNSECEQLILIFNFLIEQNFVNFTVTVRLIHTDNKKRYKKLERLLLENGISVIFDFEENSKDLTLGDVHRLNTMMEDCDIFFTLYSTLALEAKLLGKHTYFYDLFNEGEEMYMREHLQFMIHQHTIPVINNQKKLNLLLECFVPRAEMTAK